MNSVTLCYDRKDGTPVNLIEEDRYLNMMVVGATGTGKSAKVFTPLIYRDFLNGDVGLTIFDPKEDLAESVYELVKNSDRRVLYVDPIGDNCPKINPLKGDAEVVTNNLLQIFTPKNKSNNEIQDNNLSRLLIIKSIKLLKKYSNLIDGELNLYSYYYFLTNIGVGNKRTLTQLLNRLKENNKDLEYQRIIDWFLNEYMDKNKEIFYQTSNLRAKIEEIISNKYLKNMLTPNNYEDNVIDFDKHILLGDVVIINTRNTVLGYLGKLLGEFLMLEYVNSVFRRKHYAKKHGIQKIIPNFLYIDEFPTFAPVTSELFVKGRAYKVGTHIAIQNLRLLKMCGGLDTEKEAVMIESNARNLVLFSGLNGEDAKHFHRQFFNISEQELIYRPFGQIIYRIVKNRTIQPAGIGLVFFIDEKPHTNSIDEEFSFDEDGNIKHSYRNLGEVDLE